MFGAHCSALEDPPFDFFTLVFSYQEYILRSLGLFSNFLELIAYFMNKSHIVECSLYAKAR